jgi:hypothetical protein
VPGLYFLLDSDGSGSEPSPTLLPSFSCIDLDSPLCENPRIAAWAQKREGDWGRAIAPAADSRTSEMNQPQNLRPSHHGYRRARAAGRS